MTLRGVNRLLRFSFALRPDGMLEVGPVERGWVAPCDEVSLIRESFDDEMTEPYLEVAAGRRQAKVLMDRDVRAECVAAMAKRCRCAVWIDARAAEHLPLVLRRDPDSDLGRRAVENLQAVGKTYRQATLRLGIACLACASALLYVGAAYLGLVRMSADARRGFTIAPIFFTGLFGFLCFKQFQKMRQWGRYCDQFNASEPERLGTADLVQDD